MCNHVQAAAESDTAAGAEDGTVGIEVTGVAAASEQPLSFLGEPAPEHSGLPRLVTPPAAAGVGMGAAEGSETDGEAWGQLSPVSMSTGGCTVARHCCNLLATPRKCMLSIISNSALLSSRRTAFSFSLSHHQLL
jgi:hypothetical protein